MGPDVAWHLNHYQPGNLPVVFPGRLYVYDVDSEKIYTISTGQADSEVLLVANSTIYYRVTDRIYSARINGDGLTAPDLVAKAEEIRDVHWAFTKD